MRFDSLLLVVTLSITSFLSAAEPQSANAVSNDDASADTEALCENYPEFKKFNIVLCAYSTQLKDTPQAISIPKSIACAYPSIRKESRICPEADVQAMNLPTVPYLLNTPEWPKNMKPLLTVINGKALNEVLKMHEALFNNEYDISKYCASEDGELKKSDRILCGPFVPQLQLVDPAKVPSHDVNVYVAFASGATNVDLASQIQLEYAVRDAVAAYKRAIESLNIAYNINKVKPTRIKIVGRADANGSYAANLDFSQQRAYSTALALKHAFTAVGLSVPDSALSIDWVGSEESSCYEDTGTPVCRTEDSYGNFVSGRSGWRVYKGEGDRCYNDEYGRAGWHYPKKMVCSDDDRSSRVEIRLEFELIDLKDAEIKRLRARLEELKKLKAQQPVTIHQR